MPLVPGTGDEWAPEVKIPLLVALNHDVEGPSRQFGITGHWVEGFAVVGDTDLYVLVPDAVEIRPTTAARKLAAFDLYANGP